MISFAVLGLGLVDQLFPDHSGVVRAANAIYAAKRGISSSQWHDFTSRTTHHPEAADPVLVAQLQAVLGDGWATKLPLVGSHGTINPEQILPAAALARMPMGIRGLLPVAMIGAMMSSLTGTVDQATALVVNDVYKNRLRPTARLQELMSVAFGTAIVLVSVGFWMGISAGSINELWGWIIMGLGGGALGPHILRLYWWRCNAWGVVGGVSLGGSRGAAAANVFPSDRRMEAIFNHVFTVHRRNLPDFAGYRSDGCDHAP